MKLRDLGGLVFLYLVWGSNYLLIRIALGALPPFLMCAATSLPAGILLYVVLRIRGETAPRRHEWVNAALVGGLLQLGGYGGLTVAEQWVPTGIASLSFATVPLWAAILTGFFGRRPSAVEGVGLFLGFAGVALLHLGTGLWKNPGQALPLLLAAMSWALGSVLSRRLKLPRGLMASAAEITAGGVLLLGASLYAGEKALHAPNAAEWFAIGVLTFLGTLVGYCVYIFLLKHLPTSLATSYAYVNPLVAVFLGWKFNHEQLRPVTAFSGIMILTAVAFMTLHHRKQEIGANE